MRPGLSVDIEKGVPPRQVADKAPNNRHKHQALKFTELVKPDRRMSGPFWMG
jgi:hypothetical protein